MKLFHSIAQKYEEQKKKLEQFKSGQRRFSDLSHYQTLIRPDPVRRNSDLASYEGHHETTKAEELFNNEEWVMSNSKISR